MIAEAISKIQQLAVGANTAKVIEHPLDCRKALLCHPDGRVEQLEKPLYLDHKLEDLQALEDLGIDSDIATIWQCGDTVVATLDDTQANRAVVNMKTTDQWATLWSADKRNLDQKDFIQMLMVQLHDCQLEPLIPIFRKVSFSASKTGSGTVLKGKESLGKSVEAAVNTAESIPDYVDVAVQVYQQHPYKALVRCIIDVDYHAETFCLKPLAGELDNAQVATSKAIYATLKQMFPDCRVVQGSP